MIKSDTPQRDDNTGHGGVGANYFCNKCPIHRTDAWDEDFDVANLRHRVGIHCALEKIQATVTHGVFEVPFPFPLDFCLLFFFVLMASLSMLET